MVLILADAQEHVGSLKFRWEVEDIFMSRASEHSEMEELVGNPAPGPG